MHEVTLNHRDIKLFLGFPPDRVSKDMCYFYPNVSDTVVLKIVHCREYVHICDLKNDHYTFLRNLQINI